MFDGCKTVDEGTSREGRDKKKLPPKTKRQTKTKTKEKEERKQEKDSSTFTETKALTQQRDCFQLFAFS